MENVNHNFTGKKNDLMQIISGVLSFNVPFITFDFFDVNFYFSIVYNKGKFLKIDIITKKHYSLRITMDLKNNEDQGPGAHISYFSQFIPENLNGTYLYIYVDNLDIAEMIYKMSEL